jgi:hypothetical protein
MYRHQLSLAVLALAASTFAAQTAETRVLVEFDQEQDIKLFEFKHENQYFKEKPAFRPSFSDQHVTHGSKSLKIAPNEYFMSFRLPKDWSGYDSMDLDIFVEGEDPVGGTVLIGDEDWQKKGNTYWNRHNGSFNLKPGANTLSLPVNGIYRGEAGSRNNDLKYNINPKAIIRLDIGFEPKGNVTALYLDNMRLTKESRPDGILAFDFGPESQTVFPGFTPVTWNTVFGQKGATAGLLRAGWGGNSARDDTFPTRLYRDFVEMRDNEFVATVPNGKYHVWAVFDDCGYWGGETCHHSRRAIGAEGKEGWVDDRGTDGPSDYLFRFENSEPKPGCSVWDLYMKDLFKPARLTADVADGTLNLRFTADAPWSSRVAALIIYPDSIKETAEKWVSEIEARNRKEFEDRAVCLGPKPKELTVPADAQAKGYWLGFPSLEQNVTFVDAPGPSDGKLARTAAKGQRVSFSFAVRPLKGGAGEAVALTATDLKGPGGTIPATAVDLRYVHQSLSRGFNDIAYTIGPESIRSVAGSLLKLEPNLTRQFWITVAVPADAKPGVYTCEVALTSGGLKLNLPLSLEVLDLKLDEPDFVFGFFGTHVPGGLTGERAKNAWRELFQIQKDFGMNTLSGGPNIPFKGLDANGKPMLDFAACDEYFRAAKAVGFIREFHAYGGPAMVEGLHDGYVIGETGRGWEKKTGKTFKELLQIVWGAVKEHAEKEGWPPMAYGFCDEPRVIEAAQEQVQLMKAYREAVPFVKIGGSYSVRWGNEPLDKAIQEIFKTLVYSSLNEHTPTDLAKAKEFNKEIYIYNQGTSRFSFGAYQWAEMRKGVKGRIQWHLLALHGYQFFDLDGREPDTAMINWGRKEILPTIHFARCREGADDFRFAVTLYNQALRKKGTPAADAALAFLEDVNQKIGLGKGSAAQGWMGDEAFRSACIEHLKKL